MRIHVLTLFPELLASPLEYSILKRARDSGRLEVICHNIRDYASGKHQVTDEPPYGGGPGMVMKPEPIFAAVEALRASGDIAAETPIIALTAGGEPLAQQRVRALSEASELVLLCGRYEGMDERILDHLVDATISIGDYVLTGGEVAALVVIEAVARLIPGVLGDADSPLSESFSEPLLEYPHYTRPAEFRGWRVPDVLVSGNHGAIARWRREQSLRRTLARRPDLFAQHHLTTEDLDILGLGPPKRPRRGRRSAKE